MTQLTKQETEELVEIWAQDLESGKHKQGKGNLCYFRQGQKNYCCLGRLTEIVIERYKISVNIILNEQTGRYRYQWKESCTGSYVPQSICDYIGLSDSAGKFHHESGTEYLGNLNDNGVSFPVLAQLIRKHQADLFPLLSCYSNSGD